MSSPLTPCHIRPTSVSMLTIHRLGPELGPFIPKPDPDVPRSLRKWSLRFRSLRSF